MFKVTDRTLRWLKAMIFYELIHLKQKKLGDKAEWLLFLYVLAWAYDVMLL